MPAGCQPAGPALPAGGFPKGRRHRLGSAQPGERVLACISVVCPWQHMHLATSAFKSAERTCLINFGLGMPRPSPKLRLQYKRRNIWGETVLQDMIPQWSFICMYYGEVFPAEAYEALMEQVRASSPGIMCPRGISSESPTTFPRISCLHYLLA